MNTVAYLDLLGFSSVVSSDHIAALEIIYDYQTVVNQKVVDSMIHPQLKAEGEQMCADSFDTFLPFSDSIFITSSNSDLFVKQIAHFLSQSFRLNARFYSHPENENEPREVTIPETSRTTESRPLIVKKYPVLFRGGISFGEVAKSPVKSIVDEKITSIINLTGPALVEAVALEKEGKGPRLFCNNQFVEKLEQETKRKFVGEIKPGELFEIYWTNSVFMDQNDCMTEVRQIDEHLLPALRLWKAFKEHEYGDHYFEFMRLIVKGALHYFGSRNCKNIAENHIRSKYDTTLVDKLMR